MKEITPEMLRELREQIAQRMSAKRLRHTLAVEDMVARLCALYCPAHTSAMRAAALLHDLTKELSLHEQIALSLELGLPVSPADQCSPKTFHARTAAALIRRDLPQFDDPIITEAVRWHTTGHSGMTLTEKLLYLADYIDDSRTFESCVTLRRHFWDADPAAMDEAARKALLADTLLLSYDLTIRDLLSEGAPVAVDTMNARNELIYQKKGV